MGNVHELTSPLQTVPSEFPAGEPAFDALLSDLVSRHDQVEFGFPIVLRTQMLTPQRAALRALTLAYA